MTHKDMFKGIGYKSLDKQHGGSHYKKFKIQPAEFINENKLLFAEGNAINIFVGTLQKERKKILRKQYTI